MEHRHAQRIACRLDVQLYRADEFAGEATIADVSSNGLHIHTPVTLNRNELIDVVFPKDASGHGWPANERALVVFAKDGEAGLWFDKAIFTNPGILQQACQETGCCPQHPGMT